MRRLANSREEVEAVINSFKKSDYKYGNLPSDAELEAWHNSPKDGAVPNPYINACCSYSDVFEEHFGKQDIITLNVVANGYHNYLIIPMADGNLLMFDPSVEQIFGGMEKPYFLGTEQELLDMYPEKLHTGNFIADANDLEGCYFRNLKFSHADQHRFPKGEIPQCVVEFFSHAPEELGKISSISQKKRDPLKPDGTTHGRALAASPSESN